MGRRACVLAAATLVAGAMNVRASVNTTDTQGYISRAVAMFSNANYQGCIDQLILARQSGLNPSDIETAAWYEAVASFNLGLPDTKALFTDFLTQYGASVHREDARMYLGDCLFGTSYAEALAQYLKVDPRGLDPERRQDYDYRLGYCYMKLGEYDKALAAFEKLATVPRYANAARFYQGYIAYTKADYPGAEQLFNSVNTAVAPGDMADYYLAQIYFSRGQYPAAISKARNVVARVNRDPMFNAEANRIIGESLYLTGDAAGAIPHLQQYVKVAEEPMPSSLYILGLSQYNQGLYQDAVNSLKPASTQDSAMGQNALVYMGQALLKLGEKDAAIMAFDNALKLDYDNAARENAYYNYAVAKYQGGQVPFGSSVKVFEEFLTRYPKSRHADNVREYLIAGYVTDKDYDAALQAINRVSKPGASVLKAKQQVLYALGSRELAAGRLDNAISNLTQAKELASHDAETARYTTLSLGEAYLRAGKTDRATPLLLEYLDATSDSDPNRAVALYDLGYARMAQKDYAKAALNFERLINKPGDLDFATIADAHNRLGDAYFYSKNWDKALSSYSKAAKIHPPVGDYALFQEAVIAGYKGNFDTKLARLDDMMAQYPSSSLTADALLESVESYLRLDRPDQAEATLKRIIKQYPSTSQGRQAALQLAMVQDQQGMNDLAEKSYRNVVVTYPSSDEAKQAVEILKRRAAANGTMDELMAFVNRLDNAPRVDTSEADRVSFNAAEQAWLERDDISLMKKYLKDYPKGSATVRALAYLMDEADERDADDEAYTYAVRITEEWPANSAAEDAYAIRGDIEYSRGQIEKAGSAWSELATRASTPENADKARLGLMRVARDLQKQDVMLERADAVLASPTAETAARTEATFTRGLALKNAGDNSAARSAWASIATLVEDPYGAQAAVYLAQNLLDDNQLAQARKTAQDFVNSSTSNAYWLARGFIVLSDISRAQGNAYEADSFLKALKNNYPGSEADIFDAIDERLAN